MAHFSESSKSKLKSCRAELQTLFNEVIKNFDCTVLQGYRGQKQQNLLFDQGKTKVRFPDSKHNDKISMAVDVAPYPINWEDRERFHYFAGYVKGTACFLGITVRWGGDWDNDTKVDDNSFDDLPHYELVD